MKFDVELVGKIGSMALVNRENMDIDYNIMSKISRELVPGYIWVTSGATEIGRLDFLTRNKYELKGDENDIKTDYSAQGQSILMQTYRQYIDSKYSVRQFLVEHQHFNDESKCEHLKSALLRAVSQNAIPIINYNDAVSSEENRKMEIQALRECKKTVAECIDNDETASRIACLVHTKTLLILTSTDGIYEDPSDKTTLIKSISGSTIQEVLTNVENVQNFCRGSSRAGANGAKAKLEFIKEPLKQGTKIYIGNAKYGIKKILQGLAPATVIEKK